MKIQPFERNYLELLTRVKQQGSKRTDRTGVGTLSLFGESLTIPVLHDCFPLLTTKRIMVRSVLAELAGFIHGCTQLEEFHAFGTKIWDINALDPRWMDKLAPEDAGYMGRIYGAQWRRWRSVIQQIRGEIIIEETDQLSQALNLIRTDPTSRRIVVTAWNPGELDQMCLPPCHMFYQFYPDPDTGTLDILVYMRSVDTFLGLPFNIASYSTILCLVAKDTGYTPGNLTFSLGDTHIYLNHLDQVEEQLGRDGGDPAKFSFADSYTGIFEFAPGDVAISYYAPRPPIPAPMNN